MVFRHYCMDSGLVTTSGRFNSDKRAWKVLRTRLLTAGKPHRMVMLSTENTVPVNNPNGKYSEGKTTLNGSVDIRWGDIGDPWID